MGSAVGRGVHTRCRRRPGSTAGFARPGPLLLFVVDFVLFVGFLSLFVNVVVVAETQLIGGRWL